MAVSDRERQATDPVARPTSGCPAANVLPAAPLAERASRRAAPRAAAGSGRGVRPERLVSVREATRRRCCPAPLIRVLDP
jgi:hypothetical protein